ncbi:hypothetical protein GCM10027443_20960 [Pontibacter brevis]
MKALKAILDLSVLAYTVFIVLLLTTVLNENTIFDITSENQALTLYKILAAAGCLLMLVRLLANHLHIADMKYDRHQAQLKINELKVDLYEKRQAFRSSSYKKAQPKEEADTAY